MTKPKQQQRQKRKKLSNSTHDKQKMKEVLQRLAENKVKNQNIVVKLASITEINHRHKNKNKDKDKIKQQNLEQPQKAIKRGNDNKHKMIKKNKKRVNKLQQKLQQTPKNKQEQNQMQDQSQAQPQPSSQIKPQPTQQTKKVVNIFAVDSYQSEKPIIINNPIPTQHLKQQNHEMEQQLQARARKVMGENFNFDKFLQKPMRIIDQNVQPIRLYEDQGEEQVRKFQMKVPDGNKQIRRKKEIQQFRKKLPIYMKQQQIVQTIGSNLVTLICGQTGSGKSTQLPQFLIQKNYEQFGKIGITQPRRLATISLARRVAQQMSFKIGKQVGYQVRHESKQSQATIIKFMTDGILLKQMSSDPLLLAYSVIVIDEAHERKLNTDILIGLLSKLILLRHRMSNEGKCQPLRLVIMSATLRIQDFKNKKLFNFQVPILKIEAKMFPVTIFHEKNTPSDYVECAIKKCAKIHRALPSGDVLVFLTGKQQIYDMAIRLEMELNRMKVQERDGMQQQQEEQQIKVQGQYFEQQLQKQSSEILPYQILKLHSSLPLASQSQIFNIVNNSSGLPTRRFILSTNIAQTSLTVPNIKYVIDSGQEKFRYFDQVWKWRKGWGSKAMASQRAGRAGRVSHGYCYRLYSSALFANIMEQFADPQILRLPLESVVLQIKAIGFGNIFKFPFPTIPQTQQLKNSLQNLLQTGAIQGKIDMTKTKIQKNVTTSELNKNIQDPNHKQQNSNFKIVVVDNCKITALGRILSFIPLAPKLAKMLLLAHRLGNGLQKYALLIVALLTVEDIYANFYHQKDNQQVDADEGIEDKSKYMQKRKQQLIQKRKKQSKQFYSKYKQFIDKQSGSDIFSSMNIVGYFLQQLHKVHKPLNNSFEEYEKSSNYNHNESTLHAQIASLSKKLSLNSNTMRELYYNCDQILEIFITLTTPQKQNAGQNPSSIDKQNVLSLQKYCKPTAQQYSQLLSLLLSTFPKNVLRHSSKNMYSEPPEKGNQLVYIHRNSILYSLPHKPLFMGCTEIYFNQVSKRKYMRYGFAVYDLELLATFGTLAFTGNFQWDQHRGQLYGLANANVYGWTIQGIKIWDLDKLGQAKYYAFARMFLEGTCIHQLKILQKYLNASVSSIRPDNLQQKVQRLVQCFRKHNIQSLFGLNKALGMEKDFLKKQLGLWVQGKCNNWDGIYAVIKREISKYEGSSTDKASLQ